MKEDFLQISDLKKSFGSGEAKQDVPTAVIVTLFAVAGFAAGYGLMLYLFKVIVLSMDGYFRFFMKPVSMVLSVVYLLIGYALVSVIDYFRIKKIPMDVALKNVE